jgi:DNA-binding helix-hairpin-helix protein with protein kinase domain
VSDAAGSTLSTGDGRQVVLGALIKSGGAGSVYRMRDTATQVAKLYHAGIDLRVYERKVAAMLELEPQLPELVQDGTRYVQMAWPDAALRDARGRFLGYLMPVVDIDATSELEWVLQERQARRQGLPTGLGAKVTLAANLCAVIAALHRQRHYVVDLKPVNLRFYRQSLYMAMLDCDGFSIQGRGERFEAPQFTPDYLAPEFHARVLTAAGEAQQDRFALAVVVFQLLNFGIHPFTGRPQSNQVPTDIPARIAGRWYAYGLKANPTLLPTISSGHESMPVELRTLFDRAFDSSGTSRPSADEWSDLLRGYAQRAAG